MDTKMRQKIFLGLGLFLLFGSWGILGGCSSRTQLSVKTTEQPVLTKVSQERLSFQNQAAASPDVKELSAIPQVSLDPEKAKHTPLEQREDGEAVYLKFCASCHGSNGEGTPQVPRPNFKDLDYMREVTPLGLFNAIKYGKKVNFPHYKGIHHRHEQELATNLEEEILPEGRHEFGGRGRALQAQNKQPLSNQEIWNVVMYLFFQSAAKDKQDVYRQILKLAGPDKAKEVLKPENTFPVAVVMLMSAQGALFDRNCSVCHGKRGQGDGNLARTLEPKPRNFTDFGWMADKSPSHLFYSITFGRRYTAMLAWGDRLGNHFPGDPELPGDQKIRAHDLSLTDEERWAIANYLRAFTYEPPRRIVVEAQ